MSWRNLLMMLAIAGLLAVYSVFTKRSADVLTDQPAPAQPGYYLRDAVVTETDATGNARLKLHAAQIAQSPADDSIKLQQVQLNYQTAPDVSWLLTANRGNLPAQSRTIEFRGAVVVKPVPPTTNNIVLRTETLSVDTLNNLAHAPGRVNVEMDTQQMTAVGLKYDLKRQTLQLESKVHGQFQPNK